MNIFPSSLIRHLTQAMIFFNHFTVKTYNFLTSSNSHISTTYLKVVLLSSAMLLFTSPTILLSLSSGSWGVSQADVFVMWMKMVVCQRVEGRIADSDASNGFVVGRIKVTL